jgi:K+-transporting ATPase ATPase B chain
LAALASAADETPEGKSIVVAAQAAGVGARELLTPSGAQFIAFSAQTRMSGVDLSEGG